MASALSKSELLRRLLGAVEGSDAQAIVIRGTHPFLLRVYRDHGEKFDACIYIWNVTHGGGPARPTHEYRIQLTGVVPSLRDNERTFLLGWHEGFGVFVAFDIRHHDNQDSASPSIQVPLEALQGAHSHGFASHLRGNRETVIAFRPEYLVEYMQAAEGLHGTVSTSAPTRALLNKIDEVTDTEIAEIAERPRRLILASIKRWYREHDFRSRVLNAYGQRCAMCGLQLRLIEAAHIVPVAADSSNDETANGVALCATHHKAYDSNLISFDERYEIQLSEPRVAALTEQALIGKLDSFRSALLPALVLPADRRDYPTRKFITHSRRVRRWGSY